jgi:hypothetical protein
MREPVIYSIDKYNMNVYSCAKFEPCMADRANNNILAAMFQDRAVLGAQLASFDKTKVRFIATATDARNQSAVWASDLGRSIVYKTNMNGDIEMAFGKYGRGRGEFVEPSGLHVESDGSAVLVGDSKNNRLQVSFYCRIFHTGLLF